MRELRGQFARFAVGGALGFLVDVAVLYLALAAGAGLVGGRVLSFLAAVGFTWTFNRRYTFAGSRSAWREWWRYLLAMSAGMLVNFVAYRLALELLPIAWWRPALAVACGSAAGLLVNFAGARLFVFLPER
jgi:putative flippase GtrA